MPLIRVTILMAAFVAIASGCAKQSEAVSVPSEPPVETTVAAVPEPVATPAPPPPPVVKTERQLMTELFLSEMQKH